MCRERRGEFKRERPADSNSTEFGGASAVLPDWICWIETVPLAEEDTDDVRALNTGPSAEPNWKRPQLPPPLLPPPPPLLPMMMTGAAEDAVDVDNTGSRSRWFWALEIKN